MQLIILAEKNFKVINNRKLRIKNLKVININYNIDILNCVIE